MGSVMCGMPSLIQYGTRHILRGGTGGSGTMRQDQAIAHDPHDGPEHATVPTSATGLPIHSISAAGKGLRNDII